MGTTRDDGPRRSIAVIGASSSIGIRPYEDGTVRQLYRAPAVLRSQGLVARLGAYDRGDVMPPAYVDFVRPGVRPRNENGVLHYSHALAARVRDAASDGSFVLVLGGDCSIVLGCLLGAGAEGDEPVGLIYVDAHCDFATPQESVTGSVAAMCAAFAVGRGNSPLARIGGRPLVRAKDLVLVGRRDENEGDIYGQAALRALDVYDLHGATVRQRGPAKIAADALSHLEHAGVNRFWIHVDADVLDPSVVPAVDSPEPNGMSADELVNVVRPLAADPRAAGMELTIYDPRLDPTCESARALVSILDRSLT